jgi:pimeloyl-ACP methyl ester carboxylesterase
MHMEFDRELYIRSTVDTRLWVASVGKGPTVVLCDGLGCDGYIWKHILPDLKRDFHVVRWHYRGHGRSEAPEDLAAMTVEGLVDDLHKVLDELGVEEAMLIGHSMGVQVILEAALRPRGERFIGLVPLCGAPGRPLDTFKNTRLGLRIFPLLQQAADKWPRLAREFWSVAVPSPISLSIAHWFEINRFLVGVEELRPYLDRLADMDPRVFLAMLDHASRHTCEPRLGELQVPTLVVAAQRDTFTPMFRSRTMHERIVASEFFVLPEATHTGPLEWPELLNLRIRKWMAAHGLNPAAGRPRMAG